MITLVTHFSIRSMFLRKCFLPKHDENNGNVKKNKSYHMADIERKIPQHQYLYASRVSVLYQYKTTTSHIAEIYVLLGDMGMMEWREPQYGEGMAEDGFHVKPPAFVF